MSYYLVTHTLEYDIMRAKLPAILETASTTLIFSMVVSVLFYSVGVMVWRILLSLRRGRCSWSASWWWQSSVSEALPQLFVSPWFVRRSHPFRSSCSSDRLAFWLYIAATTLEPSNILSWPIQSSDCAAARFKTPSDVRTKIRITQMANTKE